MNYKDQLVLTGALNEVGAPIRENIGSSYRLGIEIDASVRLNDQWNWMPNISISKHRNRDFFFERDGSLQELGDTHIAFSPGLIVGNILMYTPSENLNLSLMTKHVSDQYMGNIDSENSLLEAYTVSDFNASYTLKNNWNLDIQLNLLVNNIFNVEYVSNGYFYTYDDTWSTPGVTTTIEGAGYYPQATRNFLLGAVIGF
jgi:iron complex outermembrane receptor protein